MDPPSAPEGVLPSTSPALPQTSEGVPPDTSFSVPPIASDHDDTSSVSAHDPLPSPTPDGPPASRRFPSRARGGTWKDGPALDRRYTHGQWKTGFTCLLSLPQYALSIASSWGQPPPAVATHLQPDLSDDPGSFTVTDVQPHILAAKSATNTADNPTYGQAINSPHAEKWWEAMESELTTLESDLQAWELVPREPWMHVLPCTWAFRLKRFPNGLAKKFKARFCIRGDRQIEGVDFFETWAPVVQWTTVRSMLVLATRMNMVSAQADITAAFVHAPLGPEEHIYVRQPAGFHRDGDLVLKLKKSVYGLRQSPRNFFQYLSSHLEKQGLIPSQLDPCLFVGKSMVVVVYVDDLLIYAKTDREIDTLISNLQAAGICIRREGTAEGFLGVDIVRSGSSITLLQVGLTKRIIKSVGLCSSLSTPIGTPAETTPLPKDVDGSPASGSFNYAAAVGMLLYLSGHLRPDIAFAVHQCARYTFHPTRRHELALIRIGRYLKGTMDKGLTMTPSSDPCVDCYPDADFAGLYGHEDSQDPHCARSRTGYVILAFGCPVLWRSRLQTEIALSTMCKVHEDNVGALTLARLEPRRMTPRSKHYAIKYHWFREKVADPSHRVTLVKIDTRNQLGDLFTKGLPLVSFVHLRRLLMGW
eukprot:CCRYP_010639-RD/>CCRYP_010639-RD protein AED:0.26 eAED:0.26 QI:0/0/0/1/0/0/3/0/643